MTPEQEAAFAKLVEDVAWLRQTVEQLLSTLNTLGASPLAGMLFGKLVKG